MSPVTANASRLKVGHFQKSHSLYTACPRRNAPDLGSVPYIKVYQYNPKHLQQNLDLLFFKGVEKTNDVCGGTINTGSHFLTKKLEI
jgi:hypothetical protein